MKTTVTGRHVEITTELDTLLLRKLEPLERRLADSVRSVHVVLSRPHRDCTAEGRVGARGDHMLNGEGEGGATWATVLGAAVDKVDQQAHTLKGTWQGRRRRVSLSASTGQ